MPEPVVDGWQRALAESSSVVTSLRVFAGRQHLLLDASPVGDPSLCAGWEIDEDWSRPVVTSGSCSFLAQTGSVLHERITAVGASDPLHPLADVWFELRAGFELATGPALVPIGWLQVDEHDIVSRRTGVEVSVTLADPGQLMEQSRMYGLLQILGGLDPLVQAERFVQDVLGEQWPVERSDTSDVTPATEVDEQDERLTLARRLAADCGHRLRWSRSNGAALLEPDAQQWTYPDHSLGEGTWTPLDAAGRRGADREVYNGVVCRGEGLNRDEPPVEYALWDTDPTSPTYYDPTDPQARAPRPFFYSSPFLVTESQCRNACLRRLPTVTGMPTVTSISTRFNPSMVPGDFVRLDDPGTATGSVYRIEQRSLDSTGAPMNVRMVERRANNGSEG